MPVRARDFISRAVEAVADRHAARCWIGHHVRREAPIRQRRRRRGLIHLYLRPHRPRDAADHRYVQELNQLGVGAQVEFPADPRQRESLLQQSRVREILRRSHGIGARAAAQREQRTVSAVDDLHDHGPVAFGRVLGPHDAQIGGEFHQPLGVARRAVEIDDDLIRGILRVQSEVHLSLDPLGAGNREIGTLRNFNLGDGRGKQARTEKECTAKKDRQRTWHARSLSPDACGITAQLVIKPARDDVNYCKKYYCPAIF